MMSSVIFWLVFWCLYTMAVLWGSQKVLDRVLALVGIRADLPSKSAYRRGSPRLQPANHPSTIKQR